MISIYKEKETQFKTNGIILDEWISFEVAHTLNGEYAFTGEYPITGNDKYLEFETNKILRAPTPEGMQAFRIYEIDKQIDRIVVEGFHVFYDLHGNNIRGFDVVGNGDTVIKELLKSADNPHPFTGSSDIESSHQFSFTDVSRNPIHALINGKHCVTFIWSAELLRDNFNIGLQERLGEDTNVTIEYGKNLTSFTNKTNVNEIVTRIVAQYNRTIKDANGEDITETIMAEVDSPLIDSYPYISTSNVTIEDTDDSLAISNEQELSEYVLNTYFNQNDVDKPKFSLNVEWIKQNKYEGLRLGDTALIKHLKYDFAYRLKITRYTYDSIEEEYTELFFGDIEGAIEGEISELGNSLSDVQGAVSSHAFSIFDLTKRLRDLESPIYYPNQVYNSSFGRFNEYGKPDFWETMGIVTTVEHLFGETSLRLSGGQFARMSGKPVQTFKWLNMSTKFNIRAIGKGVIRLSVVSQGDVLKTFSYVNNQYIQRDHFDFDIESNNWYESVKSIELHPTTKVAELRIECISGTVYVDGVTAVPVTQGSKLDIQYKDGPMNYNDVMTLRNDDLLNAKLGDMWFRTDL